MTKRRGLCTCARFLVWYSGFNREMISFVLKLTALWLLATVGVLALVYLQLPDYVNGSLLFIGACVFLAALFRLCMVDNG